MSFSSSSYTGKMRVEYDIVDGEDFYKVQYEYKDGDGRYFVPRDAWSREQAIAMRDELGRALGLPYPSIKTEGADLFLFDDDTVDGSVFTRFNFSEEEVQKCAEKFPEIIYFFVLVDAF